MYRTKLKSTNEQVAVKVLTSPSRTGVRAVLREAQLLRGLAHPNVVRLIGCMRLGRDKVLHMVMEFCDGEILS